jgi:hypothetical protein
MTYSTITFLEIANATNLPICRVRQVATVSDAMIPHLKKLAEWQRWNCGLQTYFEIRERERRAKNKRCVAKAA